MFTAYFVVNISRRGPLLPARHCWTRTPRSANGSSIMIHIQRAAVPMAMAPRHVHAWPDVTLVAADSPALAAHRRHHAIASNMKMSNIEIAFTVRAADFAQGRRILPAYDSQDCLSAPVRRQRATRDRCLPRHLSKRTSALNAFLIDERDIILFLDSMIFTGMPCSVIASPPLHASQIPPGRYRA